MKYVNAKAILPPHLLEELQEYAQGVQIYVPRKGNQRLGWGVKSGARKMLEERNRNIRRQKRQGHTISDIADAFALSEDSVRKILYS